MAEDRLFIKVQPGVDTEEAYFKEQDQKIIKELREKAAQEATARYCEEHRNHCFRCGTKSLVLVDRGDVKVDICVNENCGAVHLDPGELKLIIKDQKALSAAKKAFLSVFRK